MTSRLEKFSIRAEALARDKFGLDQPFACGRTQLDGCEDATLHLAHDNREGMIVGSFEDLIAFMETATNENFVELFFSKCRPEPRSEYDWDRFVAIGDGIIRA